MSEYMIKTYKRKLELQKSIKENGLPCTDTKTQIRGTRKMTDEKQDYAER